MAGVEAPRNPVDLGPNPTIVVKIGSSSLAAGGDGAVGGIDATRLAEYCAQIDACMRRGARVVLVSSGAIAAGLPEFGAQVRPDDSAELQAVSAVGQVVLMQAYRDAFAPFGRKPAQVLLTKQNFEDRGQYLHARTTMRRLLDADCVPVVNENDTVADDEIRFGENDRLSALVAHLIAADALVLLTDQPGLFTADPRRFADAELIDEVRGVDDALDAAAGDSGGPLGSGGMASKLAAARMASWSGVTTVIADAARPGIVEALLDGVAVGTVVRPHGHVLPSRKLWIAFAQQVAGRLVVDAGAVRALEHDGSSLLAVGIVAHEGSFGAGDAVEVVDERGALVAKGLSRLTAAELGAGRGDGTVVVHRDDLVVLR